MTRNRLKSHKIITVTEKLNKESKINRIKSDSKASFKIEKIKESNLGVKKYHSTVVHQRRTLKKKIKNKALKIPKIPEKILRIINILRHEEFLEMVTRYLQSSTTNQLDKLKYSKIISPINSEVSKLNMYERT